MQLRGGGGAGQLLILIIISQADFKSAVFVLLLTSDFIYLNSRRRAVCFSSGRINPEINQLQRNDQKINDLPGGQLQIHRLNCRKLGLLKTGGGSDPFVWF